MNVLGFSAVLGVIILVPIYSRGKEDLGDLAATTASNLENGSDALWATLVMAYVFTYVKILVSVVRCCLTVCAF